MENLIYLAKVNLYWIVFNTCFWLFFRRHTFFKLNRFYLLGTLLLALFLPLITLPEATNQNIPDVVYSLSVSTVLHSKSQVPSQSINLTFIILIVYLAGVIFMSFNMLKGFIGLFSFINKGETIKFEDHTLVLLSENENCKMGSFSFFKWLVISQNDYENSLENVLRHELVHIRQKHSVDIMLVEFLKIIFWFNPVLWLYKISMQQIHEFLADASASDREDYATFLILYSFNAPAQSLSNPFFNSSLLKRRIEMIFQNRTPRWLLSKYIMILPVLAMVVVLTAAREHLTEISDFGTKMIERGNHLRIGKSADRRLPVPRLGVKKRDEKMNSVKSDSLFIKPSLKTVQAYSSNLSYRFMRVPSIEGIDTVKKENYLTAEIALFQTISEIGRFLKKSVDFSEDNPPRTKFGNYRLGLPIIRIPSDSVKIDKP